MEKGNTSVRVQDDLYQYVNGEWLKNAVIPDDKPAFGRGNILAEKVDNQLMSDLSGFAEGEELPDLPIMEDVVRLYKKALDTDARTEAGM